MRLAALALVAASATAAHADATAYSCGASANVEVLHDKDDACTGFKVKNPSGKVMSTVKNAVRGNGAFYASPDGRSVMFVNSSPLDFADDADGIVFFRDGKKTARYTLKDLIVRTNLISESTSHTQWVWHHETSAKDGLAATFVITTYSMRTYEFDTTTGKQTVAKDADEWTDCDAIVYAGHHIHVKDKVVTIDKPGIVKGKVSWPVSFDFGELKFRDNSSGFTVCLGAKKDGGFVAKDIYDILFNTLPMH